MTLEIFINVLSDTKFLSKDLHLHYLKQIPKIINHKIL